HEDVIPCSCFTSLPVFSCRNAKPNHYLAMSGWYGSSKIKGGVAPSFIQGNWTYRKLPHSAMSTSHLAKELISNTSW
uniref:Uncharacterized protein n=1 Tax=Podarcis muralis TaxID=64176 RepID=A0A670J417_PODMU